MGLGLGLGGGVGGKDVEWMEGGVVIKSTIYMYIYIPYSYTQYLSAHFFGYKYFPDISCFLRVLLREPVQCSLSGGSVTYTVPMKNISS
jgi:hypothetical protein